MRGGSRHLFGAAVLAVVGIGAHRRAADQYLGQLAGVVPCIGVGAVIGDVAGGIVGVGVGVGVAAVGALR